ncbi:GvpL/GvpF family gas vesicle protein [Streptomyces sp. NPDC002644]
MLSSSATVGCDAARTGRLCSSAVTRRARWAAQGDIDVTVVLSGSFLVPEDAEQDFRRAVEGQARRHGTRIRLSVTGPLPCYSFVDAPTTAAPGPAGR